MKIQVFPDGDESYYVDSTDFHDTEFREFIKPLNDIIAYKCRVFGVCVDCAIDYLTDRECLPLYDGQQMIEYVQTFDFSKCPCPHV